MLAQSVNHVTLDSEPLPYEKYYVIVQIQNHTSTHRPSPYYTFGDNKFEQQSKAYWDKIKGKK